MKSSETDLRGPVCAEDESGKNINWQTVFIVGITALVLYLVLVPLAIIAFTTFRPQGLLPFESGPFTLQNYIDVFLNPTTLELLRNTFVFAGGSLSIGIVLALSLGWLIERSDLPYHEFAFALVIAPMAIPGMLAAIGWIFLLDPTVGLVNTLLRALLGLEGPKGPLNIYSLGGMVFVQGLQMVPTIFLMTSGFFRSMDPSLEEASRISGKSALTTIFRVTLPLIRPAILAAMLYYLIVAMEVFEIPGVLGLSAGIHVFSTRIYWAVNPVGGGLPNYGLASTLGAMLIFFSLIAISLYNRLTIKTRGFVTITGKGFRPQRVSLGKAKYPALLFCCSYSFLALALPSLILFWMSTHDYYAPPSWAGVTDISFKNYIKMFEYPALVKAIVNTFLLALVTATATMVICLFVGWFSVRGRTRLRYVLDTISFMPQCLPSIVLALAVMLLYLSFPNPFYGTIFIIAIALTTRYLAFGSRSMKAGFFQIHPELEEASRIAGVGWWRTCLKVILPLVAPVFINGWVWVAIHAARELSAALILFTPSSVVISTQIWGLWESGRTPLAAALGIVLIVMLVFISWLGRIVLGRTRSF